VKGIARAYVSTFFASCSNSSLEVSDKGFHVFSTVDRAIDVSKCITLGSIDESAQPNRKLERFRTTREGKLT
jgi:hypothetical protein